MTKTIRVSDETHRILSELGSKGETFDQIIRKLVDFYKEKQVKS
jgi:predicted CopG family antitoxin